jgi:hypothetical protein
MALLFKGVFNAEGIYETLYFNIKGVLEHPNLDELSKANPALSKRWEYIAKTKYKVNADAENAPTLLWKSYLEHAPYYPEFTRIVAITYANLTYENQQIKRFLKKYANEDEQAVVGDFIYILQELSNDGVQSTPKYFPTLCGYNILGYDIPLLIKRFLLHKEKIKERLEIKQIPLIIKEALDAKPWESTVIDASTVWKFNGNDTAPLMLAADFLGLKKTVDLLSATELSKYYWENVTKDPEKTLEFVALQSATQTNLVIQLMVNLRQL